MKTKSRFPGQEPCKTECQDMTDIGLDLKHHMRQIRLDRLLNRRR